MRRVDLALGRLQPVGALRALEDEGVRARRVVPVEARQRRRLAVSEIAPDDAVALGAGIARLAYRRAELAVGRLGRLVEAASRDVPQPAVIGTPQPAALEPAIGEIAGAMGATALERAATSRRFLVATMVRDGAKRV